MCYVCVVINNINGDIMKNKKIIQRHLPVTQTYEILGSWHTDEMGTCCDNCGRPISNIAQIEGGNDGRTYHVGMDCAGTLSGIQDSFDFEYVHKANFNTAKRVRAKIRKSIKNIEEKEGQGFDYRVYPCLLDRGATMVSFDVPGEYIHLYRWWETFEADVYDRYVYPMVKGLYNATEGYN